MKKSRFFGRADYCDPADHELERRQIFPATIGYKNRKFETTRYNWKAQYGALEGEAKQL